MWQHGYTVTTTYFPNLNFKLQRSMYFNYSDSIIKENSLYILEFSLILSFIPYPVFYSISCVPMRFYFDLCSLVLVYHDLAVVFRVTILPMAYNSKYEAPPLPDENPYRGYIYLSIIYYHYYYYRSISKGPTKSQLFYKIWT